MSLGEGRAPRFVRNIVVSSCLYFARYVSNTFTQPPGEMRLQAHIVHNFYTCENVFHAAEANKIGIVTKCYLQNICTQYHISKVTKNIRNAYQYLLLDYIIILVHYSCI